MTPPPQQADPTGEHRVRVSWIDRELVVRRGTRRERTFIVNGDVLLDPRRLPGTKCTPLPRHPGVISAIEITMELAVGTVLERVRREPDSRPLASTLDYLSGRTASRGERLSRRRLLVDRSGSLVEVAPIPTKSR